MADVSIGGGMSKKLDFDPEFVNGMPTVSTKEEERRRLKMDMELFLKQGGVITRCENKTFDEYKLEVLAKLNKEIIYTVSPNCNSRRN